ncbi:class I SAM-dependent methyltransferase [Uliginosibacterium sp. H1]|uniref:class I SAM-dependent methyltransferase n=1 Tax=Uliginosibacterium sp. H1 TaxID=3114757 RepID=UPI002E190429|nr:class I SAM-dependent methyltransferase [Uliginosibacterium sp. H1]
MNEAPLDVPSPIDLRDMHDARQWAQTAPARPGRQECLDLFASMIAGAGASVTRVLELGSGPGFLAERVLQATSTAFEYVALDFSAAMHTLARERLGALASRVRFVERSFKEADWMTGLGQFDWVLTHQAVHELRHKRHALALHAQVLGVLRPQGSYVVCDHFCGASGMTNDQLYMSLDEKERTLSQAGFDDISLRLLRGSLAMHQARKPVH